MPLLVRMEGTPSVGIEIIWQLIWINFPSTQSNQFQFHKMRKQFSIRHRERIKFPWHLWSSLIILLGSISLLLRRNSSRNSHIDTWGNIDLHTQPVEVNRIIPSSSKS